MIPATKSRHAKGVALLWVLLLGGLLAIVSLSFLTIASQSQRASEHGGDSQTADEILAAARAEIIAKLHDGFSATSGTLRQASVTAMPGLMEVKRFDTPLNRGKATGSAAFDNDEQSPAFFADPFRREYEGAPANPRWIPLFSHRAFAPSLQHLEIRGSEPTRPNAHYEPHAVFNINTPDNPFTPGTTWITVMDDLSSVIPRGGSSGQPLPPETCASQKPILVQWIPILKDPSKPPSRSNPMLGRYAYWLDVENSKALAGSGLRDFREHAEAPFLLGEPGLHDGGGERFDQDGSNSSLAALESLEQDLPQATTAELPDLLTRGGQAGPGLAAPALAAMRNAWMAPGGPVTSVKHLDASFLENPRRSILDEDQTVAPALYSALESSDPIHPTHLDLEQHFPDKHERSLARTVGTALTSYGSEENLDPLGQERIGLQDFQNSARSRAAILSSPLYARLTDPAYARVYQPGAPKASLAQALTPFAASGEASVAQLLLNIAEASRPDSEAPLIDEASGLVGARSMPYVAEVSTRARSGFWLLPETDRENPETLLQTTPQGSYSYTYQQKRLHHYATHAVVDLCVGLINPNPYETQPFQCEIEFDITWQSPPTDAVVTPGPYRAPLNGHFTANPMPGKDGGKLLAFGHTVNIRLGVFKVSDLEDPKFATCFRLRGWKIRRADGSLWHKVPVRTPGGAGALDFWRMAQPGMNAGSPADPQSFVAYQNGGHRSVGWFCKETLDARLPNSLDVFKWTDANTTKNQDPDLSRRVSEWLERTAKTSLLERVVCLDPTLGHRTGNPVRRGLFGNGDFYGLRGHPWRRDPAIRLQPFVAIDQTTPATQNVQHADWSIALAGENQPSASIRRPSSGRLVSSSSRISVSQASYQLARKLQAEILTHQFVRPGEEGAGISKSLTTAYLIPSVEGPAFPHPFTPLKPPTSFPIDSATTISQVDVETNTPTPAEKPAKDYVKLPDGKRGARGFFCSAPHKRPFTSVGEIGFVHSGFYQTPILIGPDQGSLPTQLNSPQNGPPMRMLLDLLQVPADGRAWNVNTTIAHDQYMALHSGGDDLADLKEGTKPSGASLHAVWMPNAQGFQPRSVGSDAFRGKEAKHLAEKDPGQLLDWEQSPFVQHRRPWDMWIGLIGGDYSRSGESRRWGVGNEAFSYYRPGYFTWKPAGDGNSSPWLDFGSDLPGLGKLLTVGMDGRKDDKKRKHRHTQRPPRRRPKPCRHQWLRRHSTPRPFHDPLRSLACPPFPLRPRAGLPSGKCRVRLGPFQNRAQSRNRCSPPARRSHRRHGQSRGNRGHRRARRTSCLRRFLSRAHGPAHQPGGFFRQRLHRLHRRRNHPRPGQKES